MSRFCAGCHMPAGLVTGQVRSRWAWNGREYGPLDEAARVGVSCDVCHGMAGTTGVGNGALIAAPHVPHSSTADGPPRPEVALCAACHEAANPATGLAVMTTYSEWLSSPYGSPASAGFRTCQTCHGSAEDHQGLSREQLAAAIRIGVSPNPEAVAGQPYTLTISLANQGAGHAFPTGVAELRQVWLEVRVTDGRGRMIYGPGETDAYGDPVEPAARYGVQWRDQSGNPTDRLWEAAARLWEHRIPAAGAVQETVKLNLPADAADPLHVEALLHYRRSAGYLNALMTTYLGEPVTAETMTIARASGTVKVK